MKQVYTRLVVLPIKVTVEHKVDEGFFYASVSAAHNESARPSTMTVRSADKETAIEEALRAAGYGLNQ